MIQSKGMKPLNKETLKIAADKMLFEMEEKQYDTLLSDFALILKQMEVYNDIPGLDDATPMVFPYEITSSYLREDVATEPLSKDDVLKNAGDIENNQIKLPKVIK